MTLDEIAYNLLNLMRGGKSNQDETISLSQIKFNVKHYRAMFLRRDFTKNGYISNHSEQDLGCVELKKVNASQCCNLPVTYDVFRTIEKIPKAVRFNFEDALTYVGDVTGTKRIPLIPSQTIQFLPYDTYTKGKYKAYMIKDYLYIYNADGIDTINVRGIFEDPEEVSKFAKCEKGECYDSANDPFPISMDMLNLINKGITSGELTLLSGTFSDTLNDRMQDPTSGGARPRQQQQEQ
jgi:hypothetical protein